MFEKLAGRTPQYLDIPAKYAVVVPYLEAEKSILFEVRADTLKRQPGEVSLPGGCVEKGESFCAAAVRETAEELLVPPAHISIKAQLDILVHFGASVIYPYVATLQQYQYTYSKDEVKEVFCVPFAYFLHTEPQVYKNEVSVTAVDEHFPYNLVGTQPYPWAKGKSEVLFYQYENRVIWGMTAKLVHNLATLYRGYYL